VAEAACKSSGLLDIPLHCQRFEACSMLRYSSREVTLRLECTGIAAPVTPSSIERVRFMTTQFFEFETFRREGLHIN